MERIRAKKSLGQNFLRSDRALGAIVRAGDLSTGDLVLEIGPGEGALTERLLASGATVVAVEKDDRLIGALEERFAAGRESGTFSLIHGDVTEEATREALADLIGGRPFKLIANIPYYITGLLLRQFLDCAPRPSRMVLLLQREVAEGIVARDRKESIQSIAVKTYGTPTVIERVPRGAFAPAPNVDSAILLVSDIADPFANEEERRWFFSVLRAGFASKRKTISNTLSALGVPKKDLEGMLSGAGVASSARPEDLRPKDWKAIATALAADERAVHADGAGKR